jgi:hypothetical protein
MFVPFSVESYRHLGQPAIELLHKLGDDAAGPGGVSRAPFVAGALRELSVGVVATFSCLLLEWACLPGIVSRISGQDGCAHGGICCVACM